VSEVSDVPSVTEESKEHSVEESSGSSEPEKAEEEFWEPEKAEEEFWEPEKAEEEFWEPEKVEEEFWEPEKAEEEFWEPEELCSVFPRAPRPKGFFPSEYTGVRILKTRKASALQKCGEKCSIVPKALITRYSW
jgi:hypothetical protein